MKTIQSFGVSRGQWKSIVLGIAVGLVTMIALTGGFAWLIEKEILDRAYMGLASAAVLVLGGLLGAACSGRGEGSFIRCICVAGGLVLLLLVLNLAAYDGRLGGAVPGALAVFGSAAAVSLIKSGGHGRRRGKYRYRKYANR